MLDGARLPGTGLPGTNVGVSLIDGYTVGVLLVVELLELSPPPQELSVITPSATNTPKPIWRTLKKFATEVKLFFNIWP